MDRKGFWATTKPSGKRKGCAHLRSIGVVIWALWITIALPIPSTAKPPRETEVVIVGAGLSGLAAAYELKKAHIPYHILEIAPRIGGRVRTVRYHRPGQPEIYADSGMEEYWQSNPADRKSTRLNSSHVSESRMPSSA